MTSLCAQRSLAGAAIRIAIAGADPDGGSLVVMPQALGVTNAVLWVEVDAAEVARRHAARLDAVTDFGVLRLLCHLPTEMSVPLSGLTDRERRVVSRLPKGVASVSDNTIRRLAVPALRLRAAVVCRRDWRTGLRAASRFAPLCPRIAVVDGPVDPVAAAEADYYGVGMCIRDEDTSDTVSLVSSSAPKKVAALDPSVWRLWEEIYLSVDATTLDAAG